MNLESKIKPLLQILAIVGIIDTIYLINLHYGDGTCVGELTTLGPYTIDCGSVAASEYSVFLGIPIAFFGFLYYLSTFVLLNFEDFFNEKVLSKINLNVDKTLLITISFAFLTSLYLLYLQLGVLELICSYCMISIIATTLKEIGIIYLFREFFIK